MQKFFFDFRGVLNHAGEGDDTGLDLEGLPEAKSLAVRALLDFARDHHPTLVAGQPISITIRENGAPALTLTLSMTVRTA